MDDYLALLAGMACAGLGGELFVRGASRFARWAHVAPGLVGATVVAFSTSSPELSVALGAALAGRPDIALGDALGSNVVNVALILGLALTISGLQASREFLRLNFPVALGIPVLTGLLALDGELSRLDGLLMLALFAAWLLATAREARRQRHDTRPANEALAERDQAWRILLASAAGLGLLGLAGKLIVAGAAGIAAALGMNPFVIGVTVVAIGTSVPELATTLIAKWRGLDEISLGTVLGSNIFNGIFIVALTALISPITVPSREVAIALTCGLAALLLSIPGRSMYIGRGRGIGLLVLYGGYLLAMLLTQQG